MRTFKIMVSLISVMLIGYISIFAYFSWVGVVKLPSGGSQLLGGVVLVLYFVIVYPLSKSLKSQNEGITKVRNARQQTELVELEKYRVMINDEMEDKVYFDDDDFMIFDTSDEETCEIIEHVMKYIKYKYTITKELTNAMDFPNIRLQHMASLNAQVLGANVL